MGDYKYRVTGPRGGKYLTTTRKEAEKLTKHGGSFKALGQRKASKVKNPRKHDYSVVVAKIKTANRWAGKYNRAVQAALAKYGDGDGRPISGVVRDHFPAAVKDNLRKLMAGFNRAQDAVGAAWHEVHPRTDFYRSAKAAPYRNKMTKGGIYGTGRRRNPHGSFRALGQRKASKVKNPKVPHQLVTGQEVVDTMAAKLADKLARHGRGGRRYYLVYKPATAKTWGQINAVTEDQDTPKGWKLATGETMPMTADRNQLKNWIRFRMKRLPLLAWDDPRPWIHSEPKDRDAAPWGDVFGGPHRNPGFSDYYATRGEQYIIKGDVVMFRYHDVPYTVVSPNNVLDYVEGGYRYDDKLFDVTLAMFAPKVLVFGHSIEDAIEEAAGWAADHAPGVFNDDATVMEAETEGWMDDLFYTESGYLTSHEMFYGEVHDPGLIAEAISAAAHWYKETWDMDTEDWRKIGRAIKKYRSKELKSRRK